MADINTEILDMIGEAVSASKRRGIPRRNALHAALYHGAMALIADGTDAAGVVRTLGEVVGGTVSPTLDTDTGEWVLTIRFSF
jgi:hypothetical protein